MADVTCCGVAVCFTLSVSLVGGPTGEVEGRGRFFGRPAFGHRPPFVVFFKCH